MKKSVQICDRCGKEESISTYGWGRIAMHEGTYDICIECNEEYKEWFEKFLKKE